MDTQTETQSSAPIQSHDPSWMQFVHALLFISLYISATSLSFLLSTIVDYFVPPLVSPTYYYFSSSYISWQVSSMVVSYPFFVFFFLWTNKRFLAHPEERKSASRKKFIYVTLVIAFLIMIFNLIRVINNLIKGNFSVNFILHVLVIFAISGAVFGYYLFDIMQSKK